MAPKATIMAKVADYGDDDDEEEEGAPKKLAALYLRVQVCRAEMGKIRILDHFTRDL